MCKQDTINNSIKYRGVCGVCFQAHPTHLIDKWVIGVRGLKQLANATKQDKTGLERMRTPTQILQDTPFMERELGIRTV